MIATTLSRLAAAIGAELIGVTPDPRSDPARSDPARSDPAPRDSALNDSVVVDSVVIDSVVVDSRAAVPGALFVALPGERVDGHDFVGRAVAAGATAAVTLRPVDGAVCLVVADAQLALGRIGRLAVDLARPQGLRVAGITGSQGKTSTKDLLAQILEAFAPTVAPAASLNNEIGVPLTASRVGPDTRYLVSEMGARGVGHIRYLCELTPPDVGVVLNVGSAHLGMFGSREAIALAKGELVEALPAEGTAVLNLGDPLVTAMAARTGAPVLGFVEPDLEADPAAVRRAVGLLTAETPVADEQGRWSFVLHDTRSGERHPVGLRLLGRHQIGNALAAAAAATALGVPVGACAEVLGRARPRSRWRMETHRRADGLLVVNDAYNANPGSVAAALRTLAGLGASRRASAPAGRTVAVLGDMLELGDGAVAEHESVGRLAAELGIGRLLLVGDYGPAVRDGALAAGYPRESVAVFDAVPELRAALAARLTGDDVVLVKASRAIGPEPVPESLTDEVPATGRPAGDEVG